MKKIMILLAFSLPFFNSCKKEGCTNSKALNYVEDAKKNDGSCFFEDDLGSTIETFSMTFSSTSALDEYTPQFDYNYGDMILLETVNEYDEWIPLPYVISNGIHLEGAYDENGTIWMYMKDDDGSFFYLSEDVSVKFRAALIKKKSLDANPNLRNMSLSEIQNLKK